MDDKEVQKYGFIVSVLGIVVLGGSAQIDWIEGMWIGVAITMPGVLMLYYAWRDWYCAQCGQHLGQGSRPDRCDRCGSNRVTNEDPGVGDAVRVKSDNQRR